MANYIEDLPDEAIVKMESRLYKTYSQFGAIINSSDDAIASVDLDKKVQIWNKAAEKIYGYKANEMIGQDISIIWPPDRVNEMEELAQKIVNKEAVKNLETVHQRKNGAKILISMTLSPILDDNDKIAGASMISRDITEQKITQEKLSRYDEVERLNRLMIDREVKMVELKEKIKELEDKLKTNNNASSKPSSPTP